MEKYIKKFINYEQEKMKKLVQELAKLDFEGKATSYQKSMKEKYQKELIISDNFIKMYMIQPEKWPLLSEIFNDFDVLSKEISQVNNLNSKEQMALIFHIIKKNLATNLLQKDTTVIDLWDLLKHNFKTITKAELENLIETGEFRTLLEQDINTLTNKEQAIREELDLFIDNYNIDINNIIKDHRLINEHYLSKQETYTMADILITINALKHLKISNDLCASIELNLTQKLAKRTKKEATKSVIIKSNIHKTKTKTYNEIQAELSNYFDFDTNSPTKYLELDDIIYCISLLIELGQSKEELYTFIKTVDIANNCYKINLITKYISLYDKLKFYEESCAYQRQLKNLEDLFQELFLLNNEDYFYAKSYFEEEFNQILKYLPRNSIYEIEKARELIRTKK
ncbi:MAG: hypothetical protein IJ509_03595 [Bacilli bacterium]|nr:hypothetical protein [Bacilli bacterium]